MEFINNINHAASGNFLLIAGPCAIESEQLAMDVCGNLVELSNEFQIPFVFKGSYRKANRSRIDSFTGIGDEKALEVLGAVGRTYNVPTITDIHSAREATMASHFVDVLQIPAFLCRQTDILISAANTECTVNIKKGQFLSPEGMEFAVTKVRDSKNDRVLVTERGTTFGYQDLVVDMRGIPVMKKFAPVILDVTHSLQQPNQSSGVTGGRPEMIETIACAGMAAGADGLFIETHPDPSIALSDGANMLKLDLMRPLLEKVLKVNQAVR